MPTLGRAASRLGEWRRGRVFRRNLRRDLTPPPPSAFAVFGDGSVIVPPARVPRPGAVRIGRNVVIHEGCWLSVVEAHPGRPPLLEIGDGARFGRGLSIACIGHVSIGQDVMTSDDVFIGDCFHEYADPDTPVLDQPMSQPDPVSIGRGAYVGAGAIILPGVSVGEFAYVGEGAVVTSDVAAGSVVYGNPSRNMPRRDLT